eukprot:524251-Pleurochrysis_carterae.AAC.1
MAPCPPSAPRLPPHALDDGGRLTVGANGLGVGQKFAQLDGSPPWATVSTLDPAHPSYHQQKPVVRKRRPGGAAAQTDSSSSLQTAKFTGGATQGADKGGGPPFKSESERRQWLLKEKQRWLVEMRLGKPPSDAEADIGSKLPQLPGQARVAGMSLDTIATPRRA